MFEISSLTKVSIHAPTWGATQKLMVIFPAMQFQSTHPHGVRHRIDGIMHVKQVFQSTHPHGVRLSHRHMFTAQIGVSIHAPTWGATQVRRRCSLFMRVSIHAPTWGATHIMLIRLDVHKFQSTHPHGVRLYTALAPSKIGVGFNPRTHMGCDYLRL